MASAAVHVTKIFTGLFSGLAHLKYGNIDRKIFTYLVISGVPGGAIGALVAVKFQDVTVVSFIVSGILLLMGLLIIVKFIEKRDVLEHEYETPHRRHLIPLGLVAAFFDAIGGGGWGPISTPVLVMNNHHPAKVIGSVNFAEFFVTVSISATFLLTIPGVELRLVIPMIIGGLIAAPLAAMITRKLPHKVLGIVVGCLIIFLSLRTILKLAGVGFLF